MLHHMRVFDNISGNFRKWDAPHLFLPFIFQKVHYYLKLCVFDLVERKEPLPRNLSTHPNWLLFVIDHDQLWHTNTQTHTGTSSLFWYGIFSKGIACWQAANEVIIFLSGGLSYCNRSVSVPLNTHICLPCSYFDKYMTQFLPIRTATALCHYSLFLCTWISLPAWLADTTSTLFLLKIPKLVFLVILNIWLG